MSKFLIFTFWRVTWETKQQNMVGNGDGKMRDWLEEFDKKIFYNEKWMLLITHCR